MHTRDEIIAFLDHLVGSDGDLETSPGATQHALAGAEIELGRLPTQLRLLLEVSNGLECRSFRLFPVYDEERVKKTWDSIQRANMPDPRSVLAEDDELRSRFLVFASIGNGTALLEKSGKEHIWIEEGEDDLSETDLDLFKFIELMVREGG